MFTSSSGPGTPGAFNLSIPCTDPIDALSKSAALIALVRASLSLPGATEGATLVLGMACDGIGRALCATAEIVNPNGDAARCLKDAGAPPYDFAASTEALDGIRADLVRRDKTELEWAEFLADCAADYEKKHPNVMRRNGHKGEALCFARVAAKWYGQSQESIYKSIRIAKGIDAGVRARLAHVWVGDNKAQLGALSRVPPDQQSAVLDLLLDEASGVKTVAAALRRLSGGEG